MKRGLRTLLGRNVGVLSAYAAAGYATSLAAAPIIARIYTPAAMGAFTFFNSLVLLATLIVTGRYEQAIVLARGDGEAHALARLALRLTVIGTLLLTPAALALWHVSREHAGLIGMWAFALLFPTAVVISAAAAIAMAARQRARDFSVLGRARFTAAVITIAGQVVLHAGQSLGLVIGGVVGQLAQLWSLRSNHNELRSAASPWRDRRIGWVAQRHSKFPRYTLPAALLDTLAQQVPTLVGFTLISATFAGFYGLAMRMLSLPANLVGSAVSQVFYPEFTAALKNPELAREKLFHTWARLAFIGGPFFLLVSLGGTEIFTWVFGSPWREAGDVAVVLAPAMFAAFVSSPTSPALLSLGRQTRSLVFAAVIVLYRVPCFALGAKTGRVLEALGALSALEVTSIIAFNAFLLRDVRAREPAASR